MLNPPMDCPNRYVSFNNFSDSTTTNGIIGGAIRGIVEAKQKKNNIKLNAEEEELGKGNPLVIFPEGTRSEEPPTPDPFKPGAFAVAIQMQVPVLPVSFITNWKLLGRGGIFNGKAGPGISEIIIDGGGFSVPYLDIKAIAEKIFYYYSCRQ